ncbi:MAG: CvpA family protein [Rubricella sp.]
MGEFTVIDIAVLLIVGVSGILAYSRGLVRETLAIGGWILAAIAAFVFAPTVEPVVRELPVLRDVVGNSCQLSILSAFAGVFVIGLIVLSFFTPLFARLIQDSALGPIDSGLGFLFGVVRGIVIVALGFIIYDQVTGGGAAPMVDDAVTRVFLADATAALRDALPTEIPPELTARYDQLIGRCSG